MESGKGGEVYIADRIAADHQEILLSQKIHALLYPARSAQRFLLHKVGQLDSIVLSVPEVIGDGIGQTPEGDGDLSHPMAAASPKRESWVWDVR